MHVIYKRQLYSVGVEYIFTETGVGWNDLWPWLSDKSLILLFYSNYVISDFESCRFEPRIRNLIDQVSTTVVNANTVSFKEDDVHDYECHSFF